MFSQVSVYSFTDWASYGAVGTYPTGMLSCYRPQQSWGKAMFLHVYVILFTGGGGSASVHAGIQPPPGTRHPPPGPGTPQEQTSPPGPGPSGPGTPRDQTPPPEQSMLEYTVNERAVRILLECIPV